MPMHLWFDHRLNDLRYAARMIRKTPGASAVAVLSLALGIGANTAIFSLVDNLLMRLLPVRAPNELQQVARTLPGRPTPATSWNYPDYCAFRDRAGAFSGLAAHSGSGAMGLQVAGSGAADVTELVYAASVSGNYFDVLGVEPAVGHLLNAADDRHLGASPYAVLGYDFWQRRFAGDPRVVGRTIRLNGYPFTVVGVAARGFNGTDVTASPNIYIPITMRTQVFGVAPGIWNTRHYWFFQVTGRLAPGNNAEKARTQLAAVYRDQEESERRAEPGGVANQGTKVVLQPAARGYSYVRNRLEKPLLVLMAVVALVLLVACANVASLMLARGVARQREIAVRLAVGGSRARLVSQLLVEAVALALIGGIVGLAFAYGCVRLLLGFLPQFGGLQVNMSVSPDVRVLAFAFLVSLVTGVVFGLVPALQSTRPNLVPALKDDTPSSAGRARLTLRRALVVFQVALSLLLVVGSGLFVRTLRNLRDVDPGFTHGESMVISVDPSRNGYKGQRLREFYERLREEVSRLPGIRSVSLAAITPLAGSRWNGDVAFEGYTWKAGEEKYVDMNAVAPRYFETLGILLVLGRDFTDNDNPPFTADPPETIAGRRDEEPPAGPRVIILNESVARRFFAGRNPIGLHVCLQEKYDPSRAYEIVGVVKDVRYFGLREATEPMLYVPTWSTGPAPKTLCLRAAAGASGLVESVRRRVTALDPAVPVLDAQTLGQQVDNNVVVERLIATLSSFFGILTLLVAGIGLYGVIACAVAGRTREIGIRVALGAPRASVLWLVVGDAVLLVGAGAALGVPAALAATRLVKSFLFNVGVQDPLTLAVGVLLLVGVGFVAAAVPARRATAVDPSTALRCQ